MKLSLSLGLLFALVASALAQVPERTELEAVFPAGNVSGVIHRLEFAADRSKVLEVEGDLFSTNTRVQLFFGYERNGWVSGDVQKWQIFLTGRTPSGELAYRIANWNFKKCLDAATHIAGSLAVAPCAGSSAQVWILRPVPGAADRSFQLVSYSTGLALQVASLADGAAVFLAWPDPAQLTQRLVMVSYAQNTLTPFSRNQYQFVDLRILPRALPGYRLVAARDQSWVNNGAPVVTKSLEYGCWERWRLVDFHLYPQPSNAGRQNSVFGLLSVRPGTYDLCQPGLAAEIGYSYMGETGRPITMWSFYRGVNQGWQILPSRNTGYVHIANTVSGFVLQTTGVGEGRPVIQAPFSGAPEQEFTIEMLPLGPG